MRRHRRARRRGSARRADARARCLCGGLTGPAEIVKPSVAAPKGGSLALVEAARTFPDQWAGQMWGGCRRSERWQSAAL